MKLILVPLSMTSQLEMSEEIFEVNVQCFLYKIYECNLNIYDNNSVYVSIDYYYIVYMISVRVTGKVYPLPLDIRHMSILYTCAYTDVFGVR